MSTHDRADELRMVDDLWPLIEQELDAAAASLPIYVASFLELYRDQATGQAVRVTLQDKFRKGEAEHARGWLNMTRNDLSIECLAEIYDLIIYRAMIRARWAASPVAAPFITNRDPGDEVDS